VKADRISCHESSPLDEQGFVIFPTCKSKSNKDHRNRQHGRAFFRRENGLTTSFPAAKLLMGFPAAAKLLIDFLDARKLLIAMTFARETFAARTFAAQPLSRSTTTERRRSGGGLAMTAAGRKRI
jgi:hypothetical protein